MKGKPDVLAGHLERGWEMKDACFATPETFFEKR